MTDPTLEPTQRYLLKTTPAGDLMLVVPDTSRNRELITDVAAHVEAAK
jgi:hypothetical protein